MTNPEKNSNIVQQDNKVEPPLERPGDNVFRIGGIADAYFAIVLTLLVLDIKIPDAADLSNQAQLVSRLGDLWPKLFAYLVTFIVASAYWLAHHWMFEQIKGYNRRLLWLNLTFLLYVGLLPLTTDLVGESVTSLTWTLYAGNMALIGFVLTAVWMYAVSSGLVNPELSLQQTRYMTLRSAVTPSIFLLSVLVTLFAADFAYLTPVLLLFAHPLLHRLFFGRVKPSKGQLKGDFWYRTMAWSPLILFILWTVWRLIEDLGQL